MVVLGRIKSAVAVNMDSSVEMGKHPGPGGAAGQSVGGFSDHLMKCQNISVTLALFPIAPQVKNYRFRTRLKRAYCPASNHSGDLLNSRLIASKTFVPPSLAFVRLGDVGKTV